MSQCRRRCAVLAASIAAVCIVLAAASPATAPAPAPAPATSSPSPPSTAPLWPLIRTADWRTPLPAASTLPPAPAPPTETPAPAGAGAPAAADGQVCGGTAIRAFVHWLLAPHGIPDPAIAVVSNAGTSAYGPGGGAIITPPCETRSGLAHETGHYVHDLAHGLDWSATLLDAETYFTGANWLLGAEAYPGIERAGHCVGFVLWGYGPYTRCPDAAMLEHARRIVSSF